LKLGDRSADSGIGTPITRPKGTPGPDEMTWKGYTQP
jgi:hypothetical protein